jgi:hypothetical protein
VAGVSRVLRAAQQARQRSTLGRAAMEKEWHRPDGTELERSRAKSRIRWRRNALMSRRHQTNKKLHNSRRRMRATHCRSDGIADGRRSNSRGWCGDADWCCRDCRCGIQLFQYDALNGPDWIAKTAARAITGRKTARNRLLPVVLRAATALWEGHQRKTGALMLSVAVSG